MRILKIFASLAFSYQALAIAAVNFPADTALTPAVLAPFSAYLTATGQWQSWDMFDTIPYDHRFAVKAVAVDAEGRETRLGPLLPGLRPYDGTLRTQTFFYRIYPGSEAAVQFWQTYARRLCAAANAAARQRQTAAVTAVRVEFDADRTRALADIRADEVVSNPVTATRGPVFCEQAG